MASPSRFTKRPPCELIANSAGERWSQELSNLILSSCNSFKLSKAVLQFHLKLSVLRGMNLRTSVLVGLLRTDNSVGCSYIWTFNEQLNMAAIKQEEKRQREGMV